MACTVAGLNYFGHSQPHTQFVEEDVQMYTPITSISQGGAIEFVVPGTIGWVLDLFNSKLDLDCKITQQDNAVLAGGNLVAPVNIPLHSIINQLEVDVGDVPIEDPNGLYPYKALLQKILNYNKDVLDTQFRRVGYAKDVRMGSTDPDAAADVRNTGLRTRGEWFATSTTVYLSDRLSADLFQQMWFLPDRLTLRVRLHRHKDSFMLKTLAPTGTAAQHNYKFVITDARLKIPRKKLSNDIITQMEHGLHTRPMYLPLRHNRLKTIALPANQTKLYEDNVVWGPLPVRVTNVWWKIEHSVDITITIHTTFNILT